MITIGILLTVLSPFSALIPAAMALYIVHKNKLLIYLNPLNIGILLIFVSASISGVLNKDRLSILIAFGMLLYFGLSVYIQNHYTDEFKIERLLHQIMILSLIAVFIGLFEKVSSFFWDMRWVSDLFWSPTYIPTKEAYRIYSTFGNPNVAADWFACMFLVSIYFIQKSHNRFRLLYIISAFLFALCMLFTGSRGAMLGLEIAILTFAVFTKSKKTRIILITTFFLVIIGALTLPVMNHSINSRTTLWQQCLLLSNEKPLFGWGLLGIYRQLGEIHGHNIWITLLTTLGFAGLCIYLSIKLYLYKSIMELFSHGCTLVPLLASIQVFIIGRGLVDFTLLVPQIGMLFFLTSALISGLDRRYNTYPAMDFANVRTIIEPHPSLKKEHGQIY